MKNIIFIPTVAEFEEDTLISLKIQEPLVKEGYTKGLMLVIKNGKKGVNSKDLINLQKNNLLPFGEDCKDISIVVMLSNYPIQEIDFLHNLSHAKEHVKKGIDFARGLPIGSRRILTFHLNSLVKEKEFLEKNKKQWIEIFYNCIIPSLKEIASYAKKKNIEVKVETVPAPEFGDSSENEERKYLGVKLNELRNPFYLTSFFGFKEIRETGLGICLDLCHNRTIYNLAWKKDPEKILHEEDIDFLSRRTLFDDVKALDEKDICHVNDGAGIYSKKDRTKHIEGMALGQGDIKDMPKIIHYLNKNKIAFVVEVNETDFKERLNTKESINYLLRLID